jgi:hypothetical protein
MTMLAMNLLDSDGTKHLTWINPTYVSRVTWHKQHYVAESERAPLYIVVVDLASTNPRVCGEFSTEDIEEAYRMLRILGILHPDDPYKEPF